MRTLRVTALACAVVGLTAGLCLGHGSDVYWITDDAENLLDQEADPGGGYRRWDGSGTAGQTQIAWLEDTTPTPHAGTYCCGMTNEDAALPYLATWPVGETGPTADTSKWFKSCSVYLWDPGAASSDASRRLTAENDGNNYMMIGTAGGETSYKYYGVVSGVETTELVITRPGPGWVFVEMGVTEEGHLKGYITPPGGARQVAFDMADAGTLTLSNGMEKLDIRTWSANQYWDDFSASQTSLDAPEGPTGSMIYIR